MSLEERSFALPEIVDGVMKILQTSADERGIELSHFFAPDVPSWVRGDESRLRQIMFNLVGNAIKFTERGNVLLICSVDDVGERSMLRFAIADSGAGIAPEIVPRLFAPFEQGDASVNRRFGGTGLGLSISRALVELMGGHIGIESQLGVGSIFWFTVPLQVVEPPAPKIVEVATTSLALNILVVDDNAINRRVAIAQLERLGHHAEAVPDGMMAVSRTSDVHYDLILMDCQMPLMDGFEASRSIRQRERNGDSQQIPIVAMTAGAAERDRDACIASGMNDFLAKPVSLSALRDALERNVLPHSPS